ncbi:Haloacid Dehalogenase Superfamily Class (subfamily) IIA [Actinomyces ruminicola]|uniref:Haloacid Dehalogenase Superfamily Class (Subfamily) IIA n=2 Tax=Actinomyces ruminicola TaxID=332524 RepID=A0A1H0AHR1_9ACTO|nr:Haloacid Dehalogenase Superfamily Class (subfamily) IIA [Actinomyces ruminicola]
MWLLPAGPPETERSMTPHHLRSGSSDNRAAAFLRGSERPLAAAYDVALLDLDGVCFAGDARVPHAAEGANGARELGMHLVFVTNNASRAPQAVVDKLADNDIDASPGEVFSAAMDAAALLHEHLPDGAPVFVIGGDGLRQALTDEGFAVVASAEDAPAAVVQGWDPAVDWAMMSEGLYAIANGALHVATNLDATLPTERGFALGNGSLVAAVANASGRKPLAGGKPFPGIYQRALRRAGGARPLAIGDRLNTDHVGARAADIPGLHVLTGVSTARDVLLATPEERPTFLHTDLRGLLQPHPEPRRTTSDGDSWWQVGDERWRVTAAGAEGQGVGFLDTASAAVSLDAYRALACAFWDYADAHGGRTDDLNVPELHVGSQENNA